MKDKIGQSVWNQSNQMHTNQQCAFTPQLTELKVNTARKRTPKIPNACIFSFRLPSDQKSIAKKDKQKRRLNVPSFEIIKNM
jgi:hypothetical protein